MEKEEKLRLQLSPEAQQELKVFADQLVLLPEDVAKRFFDSFLSLLQAGSLELVVADGALAADAGNYVISLRVAGYLELFATAASAAQGDF